MKTEMLHPRRRVLGGLFCLVAILSLLVFGCGNKAGDGNTAAAGSATTAAPAPGSAAPSAAAAGGRPAPGNPNPNAAANAAAFEAARKKAEGK